MFPTPKFPNLPGMDVQSTLDGTFRKVWDDHQTARMPKHMIRHDVDHLECTCGYKATDMTDFSRHATS